VSAKFAASNKIRGQLSSATQMNRSQYDIGTIQLEITRNLSAVADHFSVSVEELRGGGARTRLVVLARQVAIYLAMQTTTASLQEIGQEFGGKHHTTVFHSIAKIHEQRKVDTDLDRVITALLEEVRLPRAQ
jgi:chromosomal replication initiator protein